MTILFVNTVGYLNISSKNIRRLANSEIIMNLVYFKKLLYIITFSFSLSRLEF